jgi:hypothetical protein
MKLRVTEVSAVQSVVCFGLNRTGSGFSGLYGLNHSDSAAHAKHYKQLKKEGGKENARSIA